MTPSRPYLLRALNEWILDNHLTPYVVVDASLQGVDVPRDFVSNGQIVLNISPQAVRGLNIGNDYLEFSARFGGVPRQVSVPIMAVLAIYAKENGQGMVFGSEPGGAPEPPSNKGKPGSSPTPPPKGGGRDGSKPSLKIVK
ncbi:MULTISPECIES: ClpXP protease specificity-enhancing factor [unclassified Hahella]|uniref:ClpXP protease specificity-enhancing factor n=1 Tax=unclassified Hahella TaxID=2624107 RepID=UPI000FDDEE86|nr:MULTISPECIES: ClpXP protease specificity-enhancing factor [unclassified Hahella]AZZ90482.1 ClpXP protease specificity-enhancing factor [Hahella sp. KA22]MBU6951796.1 ClpXP protease specificity-enhancing factor [Hahella sp. HN01]QAY53852.1 ClpXP protease specificity-enhancing factor [Hahella sp. KA22]